MPSKYYKKYVRIPPGESVDIRPIIPLVTHPLFQRLLYVSQLANTLTVFPGASHNRFAHALGVYSKASRFCSRMAEDGFLTSFEAKNIPLFGLLHDIGHGPFSHLIEELTPYNHDKNGLRIIGELKKEIEKSGGDPAFIKSMFAHKNPLHKIIMDKNLGMDKLDYLERDVYHTGFGQRPDIESVFNYLIYLKGNLVIDKKSLEAAKQIQRLYTYMYKEVYLHKSSLISQRFIQKMIAIWLSLRKIKMEELWTYTDIELMAKIYTDPDPRLHYLYTCYVQRRLPSAGMVIRINAKKSRERVAGKDIKVIGESASFFADFAKHSKPKNLEVIEKRIAQLLKVESHLVLVVPTLSPWRFAPQDISYHDEGQVLSLKETQAEYFDSLKTELDDYMAIRVCIIGDRKLIYDNASKIHELLLGHVLLDESEASNLTLTL
ncbi:HD domain-containing protein [Candidatus Parcubacteria bacterium]|nr:HD domain-containing protein [Candidatus Parcubacteria bacterium]